MPKRHILLVETELQNRRLLEVSLSKAGFDIDVAASEGDALAKCSLRKPDLIISSTTLQDSSGFELCKSVRDRDDIHAVPFIFLSEDASVSSKIRGLELGADDYLVRPVYIKDLLSRIEILMAKAHRKLVGRSDSSTDTMRGDLTNITLIEVIQAMAASQKDGTARLDGPNARGHIWFRSGQVIDASVESLQGEAALFRMFRWEAGHFEIEFKAPERLVAIQRPVAELVHEALNQTELWEQLTQQLPALSSVCTVNFEELAQRLDELPDSHTALIRMIDGERTILEVVRSSNLSDVNALNIFSALFFEGLVNQDTAVVDSTFASQQGLTLNSLADAFVEAVEDPQISAEPEDAESLAPKQPTEERSDENAHSDADEAQEDAHDIIDDNSAHQSTSSQVVELHEAPLVEDGDDVAADEAISSTDATNIPAESEASMANQPVQSNSEEVFAEAERSFWDLAESTKTGVTEDEQPNFGFEQTERVEFESMAGASVGDGADEDEFFETSAASEFEEEEYDFEEENIPSSGLAKKFAIGMLAVFLPAAIFIFTKDSVTKKVFSKGELNDKWAEATMRTRPNVKTGPLDAGWTIPSLGDAGILPVAEGSRDTFKETRPKPKVEDAEKPTPDSKAMEPLADLKETGALVEASSTASPEQQREAAALSKKGKAQLKAESFEIAANLFEKSLALDSTNLDALRMNAQVMVELGRYQDAIDNGLKAIRLSKTPDMNVYLILGQAYHALNKKKEAVTAYKQYISIAEKSKSQETLDTAASIRGLMSRLERESPKNADSSN